jgi:GcrA cell cycle regulator
MDDLSISVPCRRIPIEELVIGVCHWPLWGGDRKPYDFDAIRYCGCPAVKGLRYCAAHAARAYTPASGRKIHW